MIAPQVDARFLSGLACRLTLDIAASGATVERGGREVHAVIGVWRPVGPAAAPAFIESGGAPQETCVPAWAGARHAAIGPSATLPPSK